MINVYQNCSKIPQDPNLNFQISGILILSLIFLGKLKPKSQLNANVPFRSIVLNAPMSSVAG